MYQTWALFRSNPPYELGLGPRRSRVGLRPAPEAGTAPTASPAPPAPRAWRASGASAPATRAAIFPARRVRPAPSPALTRKPIRLTPSAARAARATARWTGLIAWRARRAARGSTGRYERGRCATRATTTTTTATRSTRQATRAQGGVSLADVTKSARSPAAPKWPGACEGDTVVTGHRSPLVFSVNVTFFSSHDLHPAFLGRPTSD